ncbi:MAG: type II toxin-antitoxin system RelE/ParE family toxin [Chitinophagales bacterium]|nr:type II toxin-antitoxin system RelE/ParE family toxin [Chitinophagales bacterium]
MLKEKWSHEAESKLNEILAHLVANWSEKEALKFLLKTERVVSLILKRPLLYPLFKQDIRKAVITKQVTLYYKTKGKTLLIVTLFDNRQHPKKLNQIK